MRHSFGIGLMIGVAGALVAQSPAQSPAPPTPPPPVAPGWMVPGALPPGLYRSGAMPLPPPAFYDLNAYYYSGYGPWGGVFFPGGVQSYAYHRSPRQLRDIARVPYAAADRDAQDFHYRNQFMRRDESLLARNAALTEQGTQLFRAGVYDRAARVLLDAAESNHGDALCRVRLGHALVALGRYGDAARHVRRAFELQPGLATLDYDLREEYGRRDDLDRHRAALERAVQDRPHDAAATLMLAYVRYYTDGPGHAADLLRNARRLDPGNELVDKLLTVAEQFPAAPPMTPQAAPAPTSDPRPATSNPPRRQRPRSRA